MKKFRIWDKVDKRLIHSGQEGDNRFSILLNGDVYDNFKKNERRFEDFIIQQSTGLKDKNGKEIFEGDILQGVIYRNRNARTVIKWQDIRDEEWDEQIGVGFFVEDQESYEIIGNIFENPELLQN